MKLIRDHSVSVESYNEGLVVFLYDESVTDRIQETGPSILEGFGEDDASDPSLLGLAEAGDLVVFELQGDGELSIEVAVGQPLAPTEVDQGRWHLPVLRARLRLPSGRLRIECYNNLQFDPYTEEGEEGVIAEVPPGDYGLSLYHRDMFAEDEEEPEYAREVVVLTPGVGSGMEIASPMLRFPTRR